jgi:hypothetical protein
MLVLCLGPSATAQTVANSESKLDPNRTLVFLPHRDVAPPYEVTGAVLDGKAIIYVNGIQIEPNPRHGVAAFPVSKFDLCRESFSDLQCEMMALGHSHDEVVEAIAERVRSCPGVVSVERNEIQLMVQYEDGSEIEYWVTKVNCDMQKTVDWKVKSIKQALENGYAFFFTNTRHIRAKPDEYDLFVSEIHAARDGSRSPESEWIFLTPECYLRDHPTNLCLFQFFRRLQRSSEGGQE